MAALTYSSTALKETPLQTHMASLVREKAGSCVTELHFWRQDLNWSYHAPYHNIEVFLILTLLKLTQSPLPSLFHLWKVLNRNSPVLILYTQQHFIQLTTSSSLNHYPADALQYETDFFFMIKLELFFRGRLPQRWRALLSLRLRRYMITTWHHRWWSPLSVG